MIHTLTPKLRKVALRRKFASTPVRKERRHEERPKNSSNGYKELWAHNYWDIETKMDTIEKYKEEIGRHTKMWRCKHQFTSIIAQIESNKFFRASICYVNFYLLARMPNKLGQNEESSMLSFEGVQRNEKSAKGITRKVPYRRLSKLTIRYL